MNVTLIEADGVQAGGGFHAAAILRLLALGLAPAGERGPPRLANATASLSIVGFEVGNAVFVRFCNVGESADVVGVDLQLFCVFL